MTDKPLEQCPKCSSKVTNPVECETCGIVFEKYLKAEARKKTAAEQVAIKASGVRVRPVVLIAIGLVLIVAALAAVYFATRSPVTSDPQKLTPAPHARKVQKVEEASSQAMSVTNIQPLEAKGSGKDPIQRALDSTVSVRTPWGAIGSGFFIAEHAVVTNKHVIAFDEAEYQAFRNRVERNRKLIDLEIEKIDEWKSRLRQMPDGPNRKQLELIIQGKEADLGKYQSLQREDEEKLAKVRDQRFSQDIKIVTDDNKEYPVDHIVTSSSHDLALLKVSSIEGKVLKRMAKDQRLEQGQVVYALGSPLGLSNTVTSGVFSAYRRKTDTDETYLQFDAAVNPGN
ncbi:MAG: trypsin-like peptidase domain-containing protein, partial [Syntrophaceae bacterium]